MARSGEAKGEVGGTMMVLCAGLLSAMVFLAAACAAQQGPPEAPLQIPNPHYVTVDELIVIDAPVDKVWARVGGFWDITAWMNSPEWADCRYLQGDGGPGTVPHRDKVKQSRPRPLLMAGFNLIIDGHIGAKPSS